MYQRPRGTRAAVAASLGATLVLSVVGTATGLLTSLVLGALAAVGMAIALDRPIVLFYAYCAAIPFNFALPPGPAGTVARIAGLLFFVGYLVRFPDSLRPKTIPLTGWLFVGWALASTLWAINVSSAFAAWISLIQLVGISLLVASLIAAKPGIVRNGMWAYALSATVTAAVGSITYIESPALFLGRAAAFENQDPALFASALLPAALFLMGEVQSPDRRAPVRLLALGALILCVVALAVSGTRSSWLALAAAVAWWIIIQRDWRQVLALAAVALGIAGLVLWVPGMGEFLVGRAGSSLTTGGAGRTDIWLVGLYILSSAPLIGVGFGNFAMAFSPYVIAQASGGFAPIYLLSAGRGAHNVLLGTFVETGVVGGGLLALLFAAALWRTASGRSATVVRAIMLSLIVQSMFLDILGQKQLWLFLAIALGLAAAQRATRTTPAEVGSQAEFSPGTVSHRIRASARRIAPWTQAGRPA